MTMMNYETDPIQRMTKEELQEMFPDLDLSEFYDDEMIGVQFNMYGEPCRVSRIEN